jgi:hypothetical protein
MHCMGGKDANRCAPGSGSTHLEMRKALRKTSPVLAAIIWYPKRQVTRNATWCSKACLVADHRIRIHGAGRTSGGSLPNHHRKQNASGAVDGSIRFLSQPTNTNQIQRALQSQNSKARLQQQHVVH